MARLGRTMRSFALPGVVLAVAGAVGWLASEGADPGRGPSLFLPFTQRPSTSALTPIAEDTPPPQTFEALTPLQAQLRNGLIAFSHAPLQNPARYVNDATTETPAAALQCLTSAVYYEAAQEPLAGRRAVAQVVINRWASAPFPKTICGVVEQGAPRPGCQFTFECDGSRAHRPDPALWGAAQEIARLALSGEVDADVGSATHYHADYVVPVWATTMLKLVKIGRHIFYRWSGARPILNAAAQTSVDAFAADVTADAPNTSFGNEPSPPPAETATVPSAAVLPQSPPSSPNASPPPTSSAPVLAPEPAQPPPAVAAPRRALPERSLRNGPI